LSLRSYIPIDMDSLPEEFPFDFGTESFLIGINHNKSQDIFTIDIYDGAENPIKLGEPLVLNQQLWADIYDDRLPAETIIPMDESGVETEITAENFGVTVFLYIDDVAPDADDPDLDEDNNELGDYGDDSDGN